MCMNNIEQHLNSHLATTLEMSMSIATWKPLLVHDGDTHSEIEYLPYVTLDSSSFLSLGTLKVAEHSKPS